MLNRKEQAKSGRTLAEDFTPFVQRGRIAEENSRMLHYASEEREYRIWERVSKSKYFQKDVAKLADILAHSGIEATRICLISADIGSVRQLKLLGLIFIARK